MPLRAVFFDVGETLINETRLYHGWAAIMGVDPSDPRVMRCVGSIQSQAIMYRHHPGASKIQRVFKPTEDDIDVVADHIATFSLGGIRAVAENRLAEASRGRARRNARASQSARRH